jgi:EAL domain-containing protein (putative c-di-GMP-specific phosphodiesterase class I)
VSEITDALTQTGADPRCLQGEITGRGALTDLEATSNKLRQLRALGVRIAIDDFGTGYASLWYLKRLPIDVLTLDMSSPSTPSRLTSRSCRQPSRRGTRSG